MKQDLPTCYRFIVQTIVVEKMDQGFLLASRYLWNTDTDNFITAKFESESIIIVVICALVYIE